MAVYTVWVNPTNIVWNERNYSKGHVLYPSNRGLQEAGKMSLCCEVSEQEL